MQRSLRTAMLLAIITLSSGHITKKLCPDYCQCYVLQNLRNAACIGQRLPNIETGVPSDVQNLTLSNNSISVLKNYDFKELQLTSLVILNINHNHIGSIGFRAFAGMLQLQILDLSSNHLYYIHQLTFEDTPKLRALYLSANRIKITADPFLVSKSLQILDISECHLGSISSESLSMLPSLISLNLSSNQLIGMDVKALKPLKKLQKLYLSGNPFSCNGKALELQVWLDEHNIDEQICKIEKKNEDMFQKMILKDTSYNQTTDEDILNGWLGEESVDKTMKCAQPSGSSFHSQPLKSAIDKIPSLWAMLIGFEIGFASALFGTWVWLTVCSKQNKRLQTVSRRSGSWYHRVSVLSAHDQHEDNERLWIEEHVNCPGTPPPAYRDTLQLESFHVSAVP